MNLLMWGWRGNIFNASNAICRASISEDFTQEIPSRVEQRAMSVKPGSVPRLSRSNSTSILNDWKVSVHFFWQSTRPIHNFLDDKCSMSIREQSSGNSVSGSKGETSRISSAWTKGEVKNNIVSRPTTNDFELLFLWSVRCFFVTATATPRVDINWFRSVVGSDGGRGKRNVPKKQYAQVEATSERCSKTQRIHAKIEKDKPQPYPNKGYLYVDSALVGAFSFSKMRVHPASWKIRSK